MDQENVSLLIAAGSGVISIGALGVSVVGTLLANRRAKASVSIAREALDDSRKSATAALWSAHLENVHGIVGLDPFHRLVEKPMRRLRISAGALADGLPDWKGLDLWLAAEHVLISSLFRQCMEAAQPGDTPDAQFAARKPIVDWCAAATHNLRELRDGGYDAAMVAKLETTARDAAGRLRAKHGWEEPEPPALEELT